jgi:hypothetical protein
MKKTLLNSFIVLALLFCSGCASVVSLATGPRPKIHLNSNPEGATVTLNGDDGMTMTATTPAVVKLSRSKGYFQGAHYKVKFEHTGYYPSEMEIHPQINPWYFGNILAGGLIGIAIVDPLTGAMWNLSPRTVDRNLISTDQNLTPEQLKAADEAANPPRKPPVAKPPKGSSSPKGSPSS